MEDKKPNLLDLMRDMMDDHLGREDFTKAFENVVKAVKKFEAKLGDDFSQLAQTINTLASDLSERFTTELASFKQQVETRLNTAISQATNLINSKLNDALAEQQSGMEFIYDKVASLKDGEKGEKGDKGDKGDPGQDASLDPSTQEQIQRLQAQVQQLQQRPTGRAIGGRKTTYIKRHNLTSQLDGVTKSFTLPPDTIEVIGVWGTQFPVNFNPGVDWTFEGRTLTLTGEVAAPETSQTLFALIEVMFY